MTAATDAEVGVNPVAPVEVVAPVLNIFNLAIASSRLAILIRSFGTISLRISSISVSLTF
jgi:hypothetical protein